MKRIYTNLAAALTLLIYLIIPQGMSGQTRDSETIVFAELGLENGVQYSDPFGTNISVSFAGGGNDGKYYNTGSGIRTYGDGTITITANGQTITAISTTFSGDSYAPASADVWTCTGGSGTGTFGANASWSGSATEVVMTRPSGSGHWRMQAITVTYTSGGSSPSISADNVDITYDATDGAVSYTINNPVEDGELIASTESDWLTLGTVGETVPFTCTVNETVAEREAVVTFTYTYTGKESVSKNVTITQAGNPNTTLPFAYDGNGSGVSDVTGLTQSGLGNYTSSPKIKFDNTGDWLLLKINKTPGILTFDIKGNGFSGGTFTVQTSADGEIYTDMVAYTDLGSTQNERYSNLDETVRYIKWIYTEKSNGNVALGNIVIGCRINSEETIIEDIEITNQNPIQVSNGGTLTFTGTLTNTDPANLVIEDGGQLIVNNAGVQATVNKSVSHGASKDADNWYVISSPVNNITSASVTSLIQSTADDYDYYYYDEAFHTWMNHKATAITNMTNGKGYLYWNANGDELSFPGEINSGDVEIALTVTEGDLAGWNLIGNPYTHNIYKGEGTAIENSGDYALATGFYTLSNTGAWTAGTDNSTAVVPGQGLLVKATTAGTLTMTNTNASGSAKANHDNIQFAVSNSQYEDVAYAWFDKEMGLEKINHRNANIQMVYIPQDGQRYAIATMDDDTEMFNLNFKAATIGKYTLNVKADGMFSYIHVIDRLTGEDIDILVDDYSFIGSPRDDENRFIVKLKYNANGNDNVNDIFAYQNGNDIIVNGEGELQVFDVMGRFVTSLEVNGSKRINASEFSNAVYIFRMIGNDVKTQKIVVR